MTIRYRKEVLRKGNEILFPHEALNTEIKNYLVDNDVYQRVYHVSYNEQYLFIYVRKGDRIDVSFD